VLTHDKFLEVSFEYNLEKDTPQNIIGEMKVELGLFDEDLLRIKCQIEKIVQ
jgi:hypothetical protein